MTETTTQQTRTGYPSIDKPWLKFYDEKAINARLPECTMYEFLWQNNKDHLNDIAINYFDRESTFGEMFENIEKTASAFSALGVKFGDIVTVSSVTTPEIVYAIYALNRLGAISNMVDPRTSIEGIADYISEVKSKIVVTIDVAYPKIEKAVIGTSAERIIAVSPFDSLSPVKKALAVTVNKLKGAAVKLGGDSITWSAFMALGKGATPAYTAYEKNTCCLIEHTGGTTGLPKGVMLSNDNVNALSHQYYYGLQTERQQKFLNIMPPFVAYGVVVGVHMPMCCGNQIILIPQFDPEKFDKLMVKYKPNHFCGVPSHFDSLLESKLMQNFDLSFLVSAGVGGDRMNLDAEEKINHFFHTHNNVRKVAKGYGMTETSSCACLCKHGESNKLGSAGIPLVQNVLSVFDNDGNELKYGERGEICICAPTMMLGYFGRPDETDVILKKHSDGLTWVHTGDLGYMDEDGCVFVEGRLKRMIIRFDGFKVFPSFIEDVVSSHKDVSGCCAVGKPDKEHSQGMLPVVYIALKNLSIDKAKLEAELDELCRAELPEYALPTEFIFIDMLPLSPIGKVDFRKLEEMAKACA